MILESCPWLKLWQKKIKKQVGKHHLQFGRQKKLRVITTPSTTHILFKKLKKKKNKLDNITLTGYIIYIIESKEKKCLV